MMYSVCMVGDERGARGGKIETEILSQPPTLNSTWAVRGQTKPTEKPERALPLNSVRCLPLSLIIEPRGRQVACTTNLHFLCAPQTSDMQPSANTNPDNTVEKSLWNIFGFQQRLRWEGTFKVTKTIDPPAPMPMVNFSKSAAQPKLIFLDLTRAPAPRVSHTDLN